MQSESRNISLGYCRKVSEGPKCLNNVFVFDVFMNSRQYGKKAAHKKEQHGLPIFKPNYLHHVHRLL